jgi:hypothetical protein
MQRTVFSCDVCRSEQQQTNHWFVLLIEGRKLTIQPLAGNEASRSGLHVCGAQCASLKFSEFIAAMNKEEIK